MDEFEKNVVIPGNKWTTSFEPSFDFTIQDTTSLYNVYIVLRHTDAYHYNNIWLKVGIQVPGDTLRYQRSEQRLGNDANGWEGTGMDDIWEVRKLVNTAGPLKFTKSGPYHFTVGQIMRENPLENVMNIGIRIEKVR
jgi:gliding motility-associated lipoprotein GldH